MDAEEADRAALLDRLAHEIGSPVLAASLAVQIALRKLPLDSPARPALVNALGQLERVSDLARKIAGATGEATRGDPR